MNPQATRDREIIGHHSKSFALASRLLEPRTRAAAHALYAWCRRADDAVDEVTAMESATGAVARLGAELESVYSLATIPEEIVGFADVVHAYDIPLEYPRELLRGMQMDATGARYEAWDDLELYCYRVAGTVGLMMTHVFGVDDTRALRHAAHLGMGMQLTNIARDIVEDWQRARLYIPRALLNTHGIGSLADELGQVLPGTSIPGLASCAKDLVGRSQRYYSSGSAGLIALAPRNAFAVRAAALIYSQIGWELEKRSYDPTRGRARVSGARKLWLVAKAAAATFVGSALPRRRRFVSIPLLPIRYPDDVVPI